MEDSKDNKFVPFEQRPSQNIGVKDYVYEVIKFALITKVGALAGWGLGKLNETRKFLNPKYLNGLNGYAAAGLGTAIYEGFHHWKKTEGKRLGVEDATKLKEEVRKISDIGLAQQEAEKQNQVLRGMLELKYKKPQISPRQESFVKAIENEKAISAEQGQSLAR